MTLPKTLTQLLEWAETFQLDMHFNQHIPLAKQVSYLKKNQILIGFKYTMYGWFLK